MKALARKYTLLVATGLALIGFCIFSLALPEYEPNRWESVGFLLTILSVLVSFLVAINNKVTSKASIYSTDDFYPGTILELMVHHHDQENSPAKLRYDLGTWLYKMKYQDKTIILSLDKKLPIEKHGQAYVITKDEDLIPCEKKQKKKSTGDLGGFSTEV